MTTSFEAMGSAIYGRLAPVLGSAVYDTIAPPGRAMPYTIFERVDNLDEHTFNSSNEDLLYLVKAVSDRDNPFEAYSVYGTIHAYMEHAPLNVPGYTLTWCYRTTTVNYPDRDGFWHVGGLYTINIRKN